MQNETNTPDGTASAVVKPEWLRVSEACDYARVSKAMLYDWMKRGLIRNVSLKADGQKQGTRLVCHRSLRQFIESRAEGGEGESDR